MQFINDGPNIPFELIEAQERGEVVFVCGAGVSRSVGLPSFEQLTRDVYATLHEDWVGHPVEAAGMSPQSPAYDRTLYALQARLGGAGLRQAEHARREIVEAVQRALAPPRDRRFVHHGNILRLSRDAEMRPRVVTTNFDTLFERSRRRDNLGAISSRAAADMPGPGSADFEGVLHLHGRIADRYLGLPRSDLVLTSAEFGEAYLRSGWAARYVYDLARASTLVIVGYGADDPPVRYLLEVLSADRSRFRDLQPIYAFAPVDEGAAVGDTEARWKLQGVMPILYTARDQGRDHALLYDTLALWADYQDDPTGWRRARARQLMAAGPEAMTDGDWDRLAWALGRGDGGRILGEVNPTPEWWEVLRDRALVGGESAYAIDWLSQRLQDRQMFQQIVGDRALDRATLSDLTHRLNVVELPQPWDTAWRLLTRRLNAGGGAWDDGWHGLLGRLRRGDTGLDVRRGFARILTPKPTVERPFRWPDSEVPEDPKVERLRDLASVGFKIRAHADLAALMAAWPAEKDEILLRSLLRALIDSLEEATEYGFAGTGYDRASNQVKSISPHGQNQHAEGFYPLVRLVADLLQRLAATDPRAVTGFAEELAAAPYVLTRRLHLHVLTADAPFEAEPGAEALLALSDEDFWGSEFKREVMRLLVMRWNAFSDASRIALETRLTIGPPRSLFLPDPSLDEEIRAICDLEIVQRLGRLRETGGALSMSGAKTLDDLLSAHPAWEERMGERAEFAGWSESRIGEQGDVDLLAGVEPERLVDVALEYAQRDPFNQGEIWRKFAGAEPGRAFDGLVARGTSGQWLGWAWTPFFWAMAETDDAELERRVVGYLVDMRNEGLAGFGASVASWIQRRDGLAAVERSQLLTLWDKLLDVIASDDREAVLDNADALFESWNRAPGHLSKILIAELSNRGPIGGAGLPADLAPRFQRLVDLNGAQGLLANMGLISQLTFLHQVDPAWARTTLVPKLAVDHTWAPDLWSAHVRNRSLGTLELIGQIKAAFLAAIADPARFGAANEGLIGHLVALAINPTSDPRPEELPTWSETKRALARTSHEGRGRASFLIFDRLRDLTPAAGAAIWRRTLGPAFQAIWPMEPALQSSDTSLYLVWAAQKAGEAYAYAVSTIRPALVAGTRTNSLFDLLDEDKEALLNQNPQATLELLDAVVDPAQPPRGLMARLTALAQSNQAVTREPRYRRLFGIARRAAS